MHVAVGPSLSANEDSQTSGYGMYGDSFRGTENLSINLKNSIGASTDIIAILNVTTDAAKSNPDKSPMIVDIDNIEENKILRVPNMVSPFFAKDKNKTDITPRQIPKIKGKEKATSKIITSSKAINTTSVLEKPIPVAKLL